MYQGIETGADRELPFNYHKNGKMLVILQPEQNHPGYHSQPHASTNK